MPVFHYKARVPDGSITTGLVEAPSTQVATKLLHDKDLFVVALKEANDAVSLTKIMDRFKRVGFTDVVNFTRQLATMVVAGLSIPESLTILRSQTTSAPMVTMLLGIEHDIVSGGTLASALAKFPDQFPATYIALVKAGETSGTLDKVMARLAETMEAQREFRSKVQGAMVYPMIIVLGMVGVMFVMMTVVIPKMTDLYKDFNIDLPASTKLLMAVSGVFVQFWWLMIAIMVGGLIVFNRWKKTPVGRLALDSAILRVPLIGDLQTKIILVEFTRTLGMLVGAGIHLLEGLRILQDSVGNVVFVQAITEITKKVEKGFPLGDTFGQYKIFPPIVSQMMKVGEETGKLDDTLLKLSSYFESESEHLVKGLTTAIEPIIMVFLGIGVAFIVMSVISPIYNLTSSFQ